MLQLVLVRLVLGLPLAALLAHVLAGLPWPLALVYGAIALATGPTVVTPMVRQLRLAPKLGQLLEAEGLILEPVSAVLGLVLLQVILGDLGSWQEVASRLLLRLGAEWCSAAWPGCCSRRPCGAWGPSLPPGTPRGARRRWQRTGTAAHPWGAVSDVQRL